MFEATTVFAVGVSTAVVLTVFAAVVQRCSRVYRYAATLALVGHIVVTLLIPRLPFGWDIGKFHGTALAITEGTLIDASGTVASFGTFQALVYSALPADPLSLSVLNGLLAVLIVPLCCDLARRLYPDIERTGLLAVVLLFLPLPFLFLSIPMRDTLGVLLLFGVLDALARGYTDREYRAVILSVPALGALTLLRPELGVIVLAGIAAGVGAATLSGVLNRSLSFTDIAAMGAPVGVLAIPVVGPRLPVSSFNERVAYRAQGGAAYLAEMVYSSWVDVVLAAPTRALYFQFAPFPLHVNGTFDLLAVTMAPILIVLAVAAYRSASSVRTRTPILVGLVALYAVGVVGYGLIDANFGTTVRHRIPFTFLLVVVAAPVWERLEGLLRARAGQ